MTYQKITGPLMANSHPGSYCGQDAYTDMLVTDNVFFNAEDRPIQAVAASVSTQKQGLQRCHRSHSRGGGDMDMAVDCRNGTESEINGTMQAKSNGGQNLNSNQVCRTKNIVRRLTPLECERLQGFPDGWTDIGDWVDSKGKTHKAADSPRYKALGNSIATPFWFYLLRRISAQYERPATLGSLFDGIGGFPYCFEMCNGKGTAIWASEIEEFPMAVTKVRFPEHEEEDTD